MPDLLKVIAAGNGQVHVSFANGGQADIGYTNQCGEIGVTVSLTVENVIVVYSYKTRGLSSNIQALEFCLNCLDDAIKRYPKRLMEVASKFV